MRRTIFLLVSVLLFQLFTMVTTQPVIAALNHPSKTALLFPIHKSYLIPIPTTLVAQASPSRPPNNPSKIVSSLGNVRFDVNDISFLWPVPNNSREASELIASDEKTADGKSQIWPKSAFDTLIQTAQTVGVNSPTGDTRRISFNDGPLRNAFNQQKTWKVVGMRIDPSAPGSSSKIVNERGSLPQIRLIVQPVTVDGTGQVLVHDYTAHLVYNFTKGSGRPAVPDKEKFTEIVNDLKRLKANLAASGVSTDGKPLGVHLGFRMRNGQNFRNELKTFIKKHVSEGNLVERQSLI